MWVPTIDGDIDVGGLVPRSLVGYTVDRSDRNLTDVVVAGVTIGWTVIEHTGCKRYDRMHWVLSFGSNALGANDTIECTGCYRSAFVLSIRGVSDRLQSMSLGGIDRLRVVQSTLLTAVDRLVACDRRRWCGRSSCYFLLVTPLFVTILFCL
jgi:hypothetical protein